MTQGSRHILAYTLPFGVWILLQTLLPATAWAYALRAAATLVAMAVAWKWLSFREGTTSAVIATLMGLAGGLLVLALWTLPECSTFYRTWCCLPIGRLPASSNAPSPYDPAQCGWALTTAKLIGSAFIIAPVEELFFRSFVYRYLQNHDFRSVPFSRFELSAFLWTVLLFTLEHDRPLAAALCGVIYGFLSIRFGLLSAIVAHITTNLFLALYVIVYGKWGFW